MSGKTHLHPGQLQHSGSDGYRENTDFKTTQAFFHSTLGRGKLKTHIMAGMNSRAYRGKCLLFTRFVHQYEETTHRTGRTKNGPE